MGSGDSKIAKFKSGSSGTSTTSNNSKKMMTPKEYNDYAESQKTYASSGSSNVSSGSSSNKEDVQNLKENYSNKLDMANPNNPADREEIVTRIEQQQQQEKISAAASGLQKNRSTSELRRDLINEETSGTIGHVPNQPSTGEQLRESEKKDTHNAMKLGFLEPVASRYESKVAEKLSILTDSPSKYKRFSGGVLEAVAYTPTAIPRMAVGLAKDPVGTVRESTVGLAENVIADPARGTGNIVGMVAAGKGLGKGAGIAKEGVVKGVTKFDGFVGETPIPKQTVMGAETSKPIQLSNIDIPRISLASSEQGIFIKAKVREMLDSPVTKTVEPKVVQAEHIGTAFGKDIFDIQNVKSTNPKPVSSTSKPYNPLDLNHDKQITTPDRTALPKGSKLSIDEIQKMMDNPIELVSTEKSSYGKSKANYNSNNKFNQKGLPEGNIFEGFTDSGNIASPKKHRTFIGETKDGFTDIYFEVDKATALKLSKQYSGNVKNIKTSEGSFLEFEPTGLIENPVIKKSGATSLPKPHEQIGNMPETPVRPFGVEPSGNLFRFEKKVNLQEGKITSVKDIPISKEGRIFDTSGKVVNDFNIRDFYKNPETQKQLPNALKKEYHRKDFWMDESGSHAYFQDQKTFLDYKMVQKNPDFVGIMPEMQTKYVKVERQLTVKENVKLSNSQFQKLYDDAVKRGNDPLTNKGVKIERFGKSSRSKDVFIPVLRPSTGTKSDVKPSFKPFDNPNITPNPNPNPFTKINQNPKPSPKPSTTLPKPSTPRTIVDMPKTPVLPMFETKKKNKRKSKSKKSTSWEYDRIINKYNNPYEFQFKGV